MYFIQGESRYHDGQEVIISKFPMAGRAIRFCLVANILILQIGKQKLRELQKFVQD